MAEIFKHIIDTNILTLCKTNKVFLIITDNDFLVKKRDNFIKEANNTLYFLKKFSKKIKRRVIISENEEAKMKKSLNFLKKGNIFFSVTFLNKIRSLNKEIINNLYNLKSKTKKILKSIEKTQKHLIISEKNNILRMIIHTANNRKLFSFFLKKNYRPRGQLTVVIYSFFFEEKKFYLTVFVFLYLKRLSSE